MKRAAASSGRSQEVRFGPPRRGGMLVDPPARRDRHNHADHAAHGHGHGQHRRIHGSIAKDMDGRTRGVTPDMHSRGTRLEGRFLGMRGASLFGSPASRGTVARQSFAPPPRRGGEKQQHPLDRSRQFALGLCAGEGCSSAPTDTPGAVMMGDLVVLLADLVAVMRRPARARSGGVV